MFYEESLIKSLLICKICDCKLEDPRLLPCGVSICQKCAEYIANAENTHVKCRTCGNQHAIPSEGFPINQLIATLTEIKPDELHRNNHLVTDLKSKIVSLNNKTESVRLHLDIGEAKIKEKCGKVRNDIQLAIEEAHARLDTIHSEFMRKVDAHEKVCMENYKQLSQSKADIEEILSESSELSAKCDQMLKKYKLDDLELKNAIGEASSLLETIETTSEKVELKIYTESPVQFKKNVSQMASEVVGQVKFTHRELSFLDHLTKYREINFKSQLTDLVYTEGGSMISMGILLPTNSFAVTYIETNKNIKITLFDRDGAVLHDKRYAIAANFAGILASKSALFVFFLSIIRAQGGFEVERPIIIKSFDFDLNELKSIRFDHKKISCFNTHGDNLYIMDKASANHQIIKVYNSQLEEIEQFGQGDPGLPFYFAHAFSFSSLVVSDDFFILNNSNGDIDVIHRQNGINTLHKEKAIGRYKAISGFIYSDDTYACYFDKEACKLAIFNFNFDKLEEFQLDSSLIFHLF